MIKQIWRIRSNAKLFNGLNFALTIFSSLYTILVVMVLPNQITLLKNHIVSKYILLIIPLIATILCFLLYCFIRKMKTKIIETKKINRACLKPLYCIHDSLIGINFLSMYTFFFIQIELLNQAKQIPGLSPLFIYAGIISLIFYILYSCYKYKKSK